MGNEGVNRVADLGGDFGVTRPAVSQMLDRLVALGLVTRTEGSSDRRAKRIELTELGRQTVSRIMLSRHEWIERIAELMSEEEITICTKAFRILVDKARGIEEGRR
jgi:DNA-binding MarR family transcriptional regulator